ncbi:unnamed protein product [Closterium sp. NIES-54]
MAGPEERGVRGAGGSGEAQAQGQPRDSTMAPMQPSLGPPRDEPRVFGLYKFNGDNLAEWSFKMENIFDHYDLLEVMEGTEKRPENDPEKSLWVRKSAQGYLLLGQALGSSQIRHIKPFQRELEKGPKAWAALKGVHAPPTAAVAVVLERQMAALRIEEDEAVEEGVQKFFDLLTRLEGADLNYSELQKKTKLLALLPESWSSLIINLNRDLPRLSLEDVKRAILQEDFRRRELASADGAGAASIGRGYGYGRGRGRGGGRFGGSNFNGGCGSSGYGNDNKINGRGRERFDGECHFCHKSGHMWRDCYKLPDGWTLAQGQEGRGAGGGRGRGRGGRGGRGGGAASMKSAGNESESRDDRFSGQFFFASTQASAGPEKDESFEEPAAVGKVTLHSLDYWVIDSGATYSMTPRADLLTELEPSPVKHVTSALGQRAEVKGMGKAMFKGADGKMVGLKNVLWVLNLAANLISVRRLQKAGMDTSSKGAKTYTTRLGERILWDLHKDRDVYNEMWQIPLVPMPKERQVAASISTKGTSKLGEHEESGAAAKKQHKDEENPMAAAEEEYGGNMWGTIASAAFSNPTSATGECDWLTLHRRMGHVALPILQQLVKNEMVAGIRMKGEPDESDGPTERREPASHLVPGMHGMTLRPSSVPLRVPLPARPEPSLPEIPDPESDCNCAASPSVTRLLATAVTDPSFESAAASVLIAELLGFSAACRLDYASALVAESASTSPPSVAGECALETDVFEDKQEDSDSLAAAVPHFASMLLAPEGDVDARDIPTPRSYEEAITSQLCKPMHLLIKISVLLQSLLH